MSETNNLLADLDALGVHVELRPGDLLRLAPWSILSPDMIDRVRGAKPELVAHLRAVSSHRHADPLAAGLVGDARQAGARRPTPDVDRDADVAFLMERPATRVAELADNYSDGAPRTADSALRAQYKVLAERARQVHSVDDELRWTEALHQALATDAAQFNAEFPPAAVKTKAERTSKATAQLAAASIAEKPPATPTSSLKNPQLYTSDSDAWNTPAEIVARVLKVLGIIDLDPCSDARGAEANVPAAQHFVEEDNGLAREWKGHIYMNPPYGKAIVQWVEKLVQEHRSGNVSEAIALVPARVDTRWWTALSEVGRTVCFVRGRLKFSNAETGATFPSAVIYLGTDDNRFVEVFSGLGEILKRA